MFEQYYLDDGHGDYGKSYDQSNDIDYADYSTDHRDNNYFNIEKKKKKSEKAIVDNAWKSFDD